MNEPSMFDPGPEVVPTRGLTTDQRRTQRNRYLLSIGIHPITRRALHSPSGPTCGDCAHHFQSGRYHKCDLNSSSGAGTDLRVSWPACVTFQAKDAS